MSKRTRPWTRRQRKAIRLRTMASALKETRWHIDVMEMANLAIHVFGPDVVAEVLKFSGIGGTFTAVDPSQVGDLFAVRKP